MVFLVKRELPTHFSADKQGKKAAGKFTDSFLQIVWVVNFLG